MSDNANVVEQADAAVSKTASARSVGSSPTVGTRWVVHCKKEIFDVYIGRPGPWGNPFSEKQGTQANVKVDSREEAIACFKEWVAQQPDLIAKIKAELNGKVLGCWCHPKACHGDVLAEIANEP